MKTINFKILIVFTTLLLNSCGKDFVDIDPRSISTAETFLDTEEEAELAVIGLYSALQTKDLYGQNYAYFTEHYSDNAIVKDGGRAGSRYLEFVEFDVNSNNLVLNPFWDASYKAIQRANVILNRIEGIEMDQDLKQKRIGEVKFIRSMIYFDIVRIWGGVPLILNEIESPISQFGVGRDDSELVYNQIISDLNDADASGLPNVDSSGRVTDTAVRTLLAKIYMTRGNWSMASGILESIVNDNSHELLPNFADVFDIGNGNNAESIFEIQFASVEGEGSNFHRLFGPSIGDNAVSDDLINAFTEDPRFIDSYYAAGFFSFSLKYFDTASANQSARNLILMRYADVLLMLSESLNEQGYNIGNSFAHLNAIRIRAGLSALIETDLPDQDTFRDEVRKQRRLELAHENSRWFDLVRWGIALETIENAKGITIEDHQLLFPIPFEAIAENPALEQNPGYF